MMDESMASEQFPSSSFTPVSCALRRQLALVLQTAVLGGATLATGCRKQGALRAFMASLEAILSELGVKQIVVASINPLKMMWQDVFGFQPLTVDEAALAEEHLVSPDPETCVMMRKPLGAQAVYEDTLASSVSNTRKALLSTLAQHVQRRRSREGKVRISDKNGSLVHCS
jgi:hypothetical protein